MKFSDMPYTRPDMEAVRAGAQQCIEALRAAPDFAAAERAMLDMDTLSDHLSTQVALAQIRHLIDTDDGFYSGECDFIDEQLPLVQQVFEQWNRELSESRFRAQFCEKYGEYMMQSIDLSLKAFSPAIIADLQRENALTTEYQKLIASAQIPFEGGVYTVSQMTPFKTDADDGRRRRAWEATGRFFKENGEALDRLYAELTALRDGMGKKLGFAGFTELGYCRMGRSSYGPGEVARFREAVVRYLVPVCEMLQRQRAQRLGFAYPMSYDCSALLFRDGNPRPKGTADDVLAQARIFYHELSEQTGEFIDFMFENQLFDVLSKKGKAGGGFCSALPDYRAPFIFANFNGTQGDVEVVTHEAGHAFAGYAVRDIVPAQYRNPTLDACEIHSMSMEFFAWPWAEGFFGADARKFRHSHLAGALTFIPYGCMVDHFQHIVYENPGLTPEQRHERWRELSGVYMPWIALDDLPFYGEGRAWQQQMHIYTDPFYYIDYCLAQTVALQFWALAQQDRGGAWERYMRLVRLGGALPFDGLVRAAGLSLPFEEDTLKSVAQAAQRWLEENRPE